MGINIPDVVCEKCSLQMANPMTDKLGYKGMSSCTDPDGSCFSVYHSCANVKIMGSQPISDSACAGGHPNWPWSDKIPNVYDPSESATWTAGLLVDAPIEFRTSAGYCGDPQGESEVEVEVKIE